MQRLALVPVHQVGCPPVARRPRGGRRQPCRTCRRACRAPCHRSQSPAGHPAQPGGMQQLGRAGQPHTSAAPSLVQGKEGARPPGPGAPLPASHARKVEPPPTPPPAACLQLRRPSTRLWHGWQGRGGRGRMRAHLALQQAGRHLDAQHVPAGQGLPIEQLHGSCRRGGAAEQHKSILLRQCEGCARCWVQAQGTRRAADAAHSIAHPLRELRLVKNPSYTLNPS